MNRQPSDLAQQQQALLTVLFAPQDADAQALLGAQLGGAPERICRGLQAYSAHAGALAERALMAAYPVVAQLLGPDSFAALARDFWRKHPPLRGDMAQWGETLPAFVRISAQLATEPYLADVARAEWHLHCLATAPDAQPDLPSLSLLTQHDADTLMLTFAPRSACLASNWPVVSIVNAHRLQMPTLEQAGERLRGGVAETAVLWRRGFAPQLREAMPDEPSFIGAQLDGLSLAEAVARAPALDFATWLHLAVQTGLVLGAQMRPIPSSNEPPPQP